MEIPEKRPHYRYEEKEVLFQQSIERGVEYALFLVRDRFEDTKNEKNKLPFHNSAHTKDVKERAVRIASAMHRADPTFFSERYIGIATIAAVFHDTMQNWVENPVSENGYEKIMRKRLSGDNERASAEEAVQYMNEANEERGEIFTGEDKRAVYEAIMATVPGFDPEKRTVIQPSLTAESGIVARIVALADLGTAGMDGPEKFLPEGNALFREENLDILDALKSMEKIDTSAKERYKKRMFRWTAFQAEFAAGRKALLEKELAGIPEAIKEAVRELFSAFDASIKASDVQTKRREKMPFEKLIADMGY